MKPEAELLGVAATPAEGNEKWGDAPNPLTPKLARETIAWCACYNNRFLAPSPDSLN